MVRRTAEDTRQLILEAGVQLLLERGATAGVQHIRLQEVLREVGLTTGAAYRIWADQDEFHRDLAVELVGLRFAPPVSSATNAIQEVLDSGGSLADVARTAALDHVTYASKFHLEPESRDSHAFITALALRTAAGAWPELRVASAERHRESIDAFAEFYTALLHRFGRRMRSPLTIVDFTEAMAALGEGFAIRAAEGMDHPTYDIPDGAEVPSGEWTLFGIGILGLVEGFTVPLSDAGPLSDGGRLADSGSPADTVPMTEEDTPRPTGASRRRAGVADSPIEKDASSESRNSTSASRSPAQS